MSLEENGKQDTLLEAPKILTFAFRWEDVDASDASYMLPKRIQILQTLLEHPEISLHTLNAPQSALRGVTPLGLAAWLNVPDMVRLLLEVCPGIVSVDGMDSLGATPLMCTCLNCSACASNCKINDMSLSTDAARDGSIEVVEQLVTSILPNHPLTMFTHLFITFIR